MREPGWWVIESKWGRSVAYLSTDGTLFPCTTECDSYMPDGTYDDYRLIRRIDLDALRFEED